MCLRASVPAFCTAIMTSLALATPTPTLPFLSPRTTTALNDSCFPPFTTLVTRRICTTRSSNSLGPRSRRPLSPSSIPLESDLEDARPEKAFPYSASYAAVISSSVSSSSSSSSNAWGERDKLELPALETEVEAGAPPLENRILEPHKELEKHKAAGEEAAASAEVRQEEIGVEEKPTVEETPAPMTWESEREKAMTRALYRRAAPQLCRDASLPFASSFLVRQPQSVPRLCSLHDCAWSWPTFSLPCR